MAHHIVVFAAAYENVPGNIRLLPGGDSFREVYFDVFGAIEEALRQRANGAVCCVIRPSWNETDEDGNIFFREFRSSGGKFSEVKWMWRNKHGECLLGEPPVSQDIADTALSGLMSNIPIGSKVKEDCFVDQVGEKERAYDCG